MNGLMKQSGVIYQAFTLFSPFGTRLATAFGVSEGWELKDISMLERLVVRVQSALFVGKI